jgi:5'-nucleotidase / UDP-sugar diphosphatase
MKILSGLLILGLASNALAFTKGKTYKITILHTNDHHGRFWQNKDGEWGLAARATLIQKLRDEAKKTGTHILLLDAGDVNTGVPQSDLQDAEPDFRGMGKLKYDAMAIGNHEFDKPLKTIFQQRTWAGFPFLSGNIFYKNSGELVFPSHVKLKRADLNITVIGLTTEDTPKKSNPKNSEGLEFKAAVGEAKKFVPELRKETDILIAVTHMGHYPNENHGPHSPGDVTLAREVDGIDIIVGGHTQKPLFDPDIQNGTIIVQAFEWGKYVGKVDLEFKDGKLTLVKSELLPINHKDQKQKIAEDKEMLKLLSPFKKKGDSGLLVQVGDAEGEFSGERDEIRNKETALGALVTEAYREKFNADIGLTNSGGIRASLPAGKITYETVLTVLPFNNEVVTANLKGEELKKYLEEIITKFPSGGSLGGFPQISGVRINVDKKKKKISRIKVGGKLLDPKKSYTIALPQFIAGGGDDYPKLEYVKHGFIDADILKDHIQKKKLIKAQDYPVSFYIKWK